MGVLKKSEAEAFSNGPTCSGYAFPFGDKDIDIAVVTVNGRYPEKGYALNEVSKEIGYVLGGTGEIVIAGGMPRQIGAGDAVMIQPGEAFYWRGEGLEMLMPCSPAFNPAQHKNVT